MSNEVSKKQLELATALLKKHKREKIYINTLTGHMHFSAIGSKEGAKDLNNVIVFDGKSSEQAFAKEKKDAVMIVLPEGDPNENWTADQLIAFAKENHPELSLRSNYLPATILEKIQEAAAKNNK